MAPSLSALRVCTDEDVMVDAVIASTQRTRSDSLPSFGRDLVPYFVPGAAKFTEDSVNVNTDVDALRRGGASILEIPEPAATSRVGRKSRNPSGKKVSKKNSMPETDSRKQWSPSFEVRSVSSNTALVQPISNGKGRSATPPSAPATASLRSYHSGPVRSPTIEAWAGPTYVNSPAPSSLPVPSFLMSAKAGSHLQSSPSSPLGSLFSASDSTPQSAAAVFNTNFVYHNVNPAMIESNLKQLLQVA